MIITLKTKRKKQRQRQARVRTLAVAARQWPDVEMTKNIAYQTGEVSKRSEPGKVMTTTNANTTAVPSTTRMHFNNQFTTNITDVSLDSEGYVRLNKPTP